MAVVYNKLNNFNHMINEYARLTGTIAALEAETIAQKRLIERLTLENQALQEKLGEIEDYTPDPDH